MLQCIRKKILRGFTATQDIIMTATTEKLRTFLENSLTAYHAKDNIKEKLVENGFVPLSQTQDWEICEGGKYFVERAASLIAFTVGQLDHFIYKIVATHVDSPALKLKENPERKTEGMVTLNVERYGGGLWYSFFALIALLRLE